MRRLIPLPAAVLLILSLLGAASGCKRKRRPVVQASDDAVFASMIDMSDPRAKAQLVKGFFDLESGAWRWTTRQFDVVLGPPRGAAEKGATLVLRFAIPDVEMQRLKPMTLSAEANAVHLAPEQYTSGGDLTYTREVPAAALSSGNVAVSFTLDKALPPSEADSRELGVIVKAVGFELK
jgi:hypothetical protein